MATPCKISVTALVVVGAKEIISTDKMHDETTDVKSVINPAMDKAAAEAERNLCFVKAEVYASAEAMDRRGTVLENADLGGALLISRSVLPRPPLWRARPPYFENRNFS